MSDETCVGGAESEEESLLGAPEACPPSIRVFVSFDLEHDGPLYELLLEQSRIDGSGFQIVGCSQRLMDEGVWSGGVRQRIRDADQVIVICGENTEASSAVGAELRIAREERTPHFLLWGRRDLMCTKPMGAPTTEGIYNWTPETLQERLAFIRRTGAIC